MQKESWNLVMGDLPSPGKEIGSFLHKLGHLQGWQNTDIDSIWLYGNEDQNKNKSF